MYFRPFSYTVCFRPFQRVETLGVGWGVGVGCGCVLKFILICRINIKTIYNCCFKMVELEIKILGNPV